MKMTKYHQQHKGPYDCRGGITHAQDPSNRYAPEQEAWLRERKLYTGRMLVDIAHLPPELKFL